MKAYSILKAGEVFNLTVASAKAFRVLLARLSEVAANEPEAIPAARVEHDHGVVADILWPDSKEAKSKLMAQAEAILGKPAKQRSDAENLACDATRARWSRLVKYNPALRVDNRGGDTSTSPKKKGKAKGKAKASGAVMVRAAKAAERAAKSVDVARETVATLMADKKAKAPELAEAIKALTAATTIAAKVEAPAMPAEITQESMIIAAHKAFAELARIAKAGAKVLSQDQKEYLIECEKGARELFAPAKAQA